MQKFFEKDTADAARIETIHSILEDFATDLNDLITFLKGQDSYTDRQLEIICERAQAICNRWTGKFYTDVDGVLGEECHIYSEDNLVDYCKYTNADRNFNGYQDWFDKKIKPNMPETELDLRECAKKCDFR